MGPVPVRTEQSAAGTVHEVYRTRDAWLRRPRPGSRAEALSALQAHLGDNVPFYRDTADVRGGGLPALPLVDRALHRSRGELFRSVTEPAGGYVLTTSGTTGAPLEVSLDEAYWYAVNYHFFEQVRQLAGLPLDDFARGRISVLFVSSKATRSNFVRPLPSLNDSLYLRLQLTSSPESVVALYRKAQAAVLYGKPTYLLDLRATLVAAGLRRAPWSPRLLLASGEPLYPDDRARLTAFFGAPIVDALASTEGGLIAASAPGGTRHTVFGDNVFLEVRTSDGEVTTTGAGELVLTNLLNRGTAFVRYLTGDFAELVTDAGDGTQSLVRLRGRESATLTFRGGRLTTRELSDALTGVPGLGDFQIAAGDGEPASLRWTPDALCADPDATEAGLRARVRELLPGEDCVLERCRAITPPGGKKHRFLDRTALRRGER